jgi:hypothetical protein
MHSFSGHPIESGRPADAIAIGAEMRRGCVVCDAEQYIGPRQGSRFSHSRKTQSCENQQPEVTTLEKGSPAHTGIMKQTGPRRSINFGLTQLKTNSDML